MFQLSILCLSSFCRTHKEIRRKIHEAVTFYHLRVKYVTLQELLTYKMQSLIRESNKISKHSQVIKNECQVRVELYRMSFQSIPPCFLSSDQSLLLKFLLTSLFILPLCVSTYGTAQFKLDRTHMQQGYDMTRFSFHSSASLRVHARLVTSILPCKALMYALDVCMMHMCMMHACMSGMHTPNLDYACMQIVSQGQRNKLYKHVYVLRCNPLVIQDINPAKEYLTVKLRKTIRGCVFYRLSSVILG